MIPRAKTDIKAFDIIQPQTGEILFITTCSSSLYAKFLKMTLTCTALELSHMLPSLLPLSTLSLHQHQ